MMGEGGGDPRVTTNPKATQITQQDYDASNHVALSEIVRESRDRETEMAGLNPMQI
jgi:hypothetical protein